MEDIICEEYLIIDVEEKLDFAPSCPFNFICDIPRIP